MKAFFDTNILIDYLNGHQQAADEFKLYDDLNISIITYMEVLVGVRSSGHEAVVRRFLNSFNIVELSSDIADRTVEVRKELKVKLPDAIIYATARENNGLLVTRNTKGFSPDRPEVRLPYQIS